MLKARERIDRLIPQQLDIIQSPEYFTFSLDALLLADFAKINKRQKRIIDFCTGNGVVPLILSQACSGQLYGVDIQPALADMARRSVALNQLEDRIKILAADINDLPTYFDQQSFDIVTCNPPYFKVYPDSRLNPNQAKAIARHEITMSLADIFSQAQYLLKEKGKLYVVHRPERLTELLVAGQHHQLTLKRMRLVQAKVDQAANTVLLEFIKRGQDKGLVVEPTLISHLANNDYSPEVRRIYYGD
ncbi:methyltransferase [Aerococcus urinaehominis]|uniref:Methyltransferase n=1 Tax=Aerococcus urinaehominis TaxID=128944 RepID=A0A109RGK9_9LACT|nr:tRNA1(Val) (adenine(37)-N6)-methyltransferase [Aerococcus urinaehominis]AMB99221.1 methyltransferase [Aerococcus urinaehominis]SDM31948.1 tRNA1(Val) A37 N6-methylase TrmN6 [Aerococcus urinaehominis]